MTIDNWIHEKGSTSNVYLEVALKILFFPWETEITTQ